MAIKSTGKFNEEVSQSLLSAVQLEDVNTVENLLSTVENPESYLNRQYNEPHEQQCTLLVIACVNKFEDMVKLLLNYSKIDLEVVNDVRLVEKDYSFVMYQDVTVLWVAAAINEFNIVKLLVEHGAQINHTTKTRSTAFRCACWNENIDMARYLKQNGANVHIAKQENETNLIASVINENLNIITYLVDELGCDVNESMIDGRSPLYFAVNSGSSKIVEYLLKHGAKNFRSKYDNMSPILLAAENRNVDLIEVISPHCSLLEQIEANELLASSFSCIEHGTVDFQKSYEYYCRALELRVEHNLPKILRSSTIEVFDNRQECQTVDDLEKIRQNNDVMYVDALLVRERLLGENNSKFLYSLRYRGAFLIDEGQHHRGVDCWLYELNLCRQYSLNIESEYLRCWVHVFSDMLMTPTTISDIALQSIMTVIIEKLEQVTKEFNYNLYTLLFLITIVTRVLLKSTTTQSIRLAFYQKIKYIVKRQYVAQDYKWSLLHLTLSNYSLMKGSLIDPICKYPCLHTCSLLLQCGAEINAMDIVRDTPLHVFVSNPNITDLTLVQYLCDAGAHLDYINALGETPVDIAQSSIVKQYLKTRANLSLKCLCARIIRKNEIPFHGMTSKILAQFVEKH